MTVLQSITIEVLEGRNLPGRILINMGTIKEMTGDNLDTDPVWNQDFHLPAFGDETLEFTSVNGPQVVGSASVSLQELELAEGNAVEMWLPIAHEKENVGELLIKVDGLFADPNAAATAEGALQPVLFSILRAEGLPSKGDIYAIATARNSAMQTATIHASAAPVWDETFPVALGAEDTVEVSVEDELLAVMVGACSVKAQDLLGEFGQELELPLMNAANEPVGNIVVRLDPDENAVETPAEAAANLPTEPVEVVVKAVCGEQLPELSSVEAVLAYGETVFRTAPKPSTGTVQFDEQFAFVLDPSGVVDVSLQSGDVLIGRADVPAEALIQLVETQKHLEVEVGDDDGAVRGILVLAASDRFSEAAAAAAPADAPAAVPAEAPAQPTLITVPIPIQVPIPVVSLTAPEEPLPSVAQHNGLAVEVVTVTPTPPTAAKELALKLTIGGQEVSTSGHPPTDDVWQDVCNFLDVADTDVVDGVVLGDGELVADFIVPVSKLLEVAGSGQCLEVELTKEGVPAGTIVLGSSFEGATVTTGGLREPAAPTLDTWTPLYASEPVLVTRHTLDGKTITVNPADGHVSTTASAITRQVVQLSSPVTISAAAIATASTVSVTRHLLDGHVLTSSNAASPTAVLPAYPIATTVKVTRRLLDGNVVTTTGPYPHTLSPRLALEPLTHISAYHTLVTRRPLEGYPIPVAFGTPLTKVVTHTTTSSSAAEAESSAVLSPPSDPPMVRTTSVETLPTSGLPAAPAPPQPPHRIPDSYISPLPPQDLLVPNYRGVPWPPLRYQAGHRTVLSPSLAASTVPVQIPASAKRYPGGRPLQLPIRVVGGDDEVRIVSVRVPSTEHLGFSYTVPPQLGRAVPFATGYPFVPGGRLPAAAPTQAWRSVTKPAQQPSTPEAVIAETQASGAYSGRVLNVSSREYFL